MIPLPERNFTLHLIRHAQSENNTNGRIGGNECSITEEGREQALKLRRVFELAEFDPAVVWVSSLPRARQTAEIVFPTSHFLESNDLIELQRGDWNNLDRTSTWTSDIKRRMDWEGMDFAPPNGESMKACASRMYRWVLDTCFERNQGDGAVLPVVTHGLATACLLHRIFGIDSDKVWRIRLQNTSVTTIRYSASFGWDLVSLNSCPHLPLNFDHIKPGV